MSDKNEKYILKSNSTNYQISLSNSFQEITENHLVEFGLKNTSNHQERVLLKIAMYNKQFALKSYKEFPLKMIFIENNVEKEKIIINNSIEILYNISNIRIFFPNYSVKNVFLYIKPHNELDLSHNVENYKNDKENKGNQNYYDIIDVKNESIKTNLSSINKFPKHIKINTDNTRIDTISDINENSYLTLLSNHTTKKDTNTSSENNLKKYKIIIEDDGNEMIKAKDKIDNIYFSYNDNKDLYYKNNVHIDTINNDEAFSRNNPNPFIEYNGNSKRKRNFHFNNINPPSHINCDTKIIIDKENYIIDKNKSNFIDIFENKVQNKLYNNEEKINNEVDMISLSPKNSGNRLKKVANLLLSTPICQNCSICLEHIKNKTHLDTCGHEFCKDCIENWAKMTNVCPLCKEDFNKMIYYDKNREMKKHVKKKKFEYEEEEESWLENCQDACMKCNLKNNEHLMLVCDKCNYYVCHIHCANLEKIPEEDWYCFNCIENNNFNSCEIEKNNFRKSKTLNESLENDKKISLDDNENYFHNRRTNFRNGKRKIDRKIIDDLIEKELSSEKFNNEEDDDFYESINTIIEKTDIKTRLRRRNENDRGSKNREVKKRNKKYN